MIHLGQDVLKIGNVCTGRMRDTAIGAWIKQWRHWGGRGATDSFFHFNQSDSPYARFFEEVGSGRRFGDIL